MRTKSWQLSSAANVCLPVILLKVPGFLPAHKLAHNAFMQGLHRNAHRRQQPFFFFFFILPHKTGWIDTSWSRSQDSKKPRCKGHRSYILQSLAMLRDDWQISLQLPRIVFVCQRLKPQDSIQQCHAVCTLWVWLISYTECKRKHNIKHMQNNPLEMSVKTKN